jgi:Tfp pilus assembly protein PilE
MADDNFSEIEPARQSDGEKKLKNKRDSVRFWQKWIPAAKRAARRHMVDSRRAWQEYDSDTDRIFEDGSRNWDGTATGAWDGERYPIYYSCIQTILSYYYSRTPDIFVRRLFDFEDKVGGIMCKITEHMGKYLIENGDYNATMRATVQDFANADKAAPQVCYYEVPGKVKKEMPVYQAADSDDYLDESGKKVQDEIFQDPNTGEFFSFVEADELLEQCIKAKPLPYDQVLHTPQAKMPEEIEDMAMYFCLTRHEAVEKFGEQVVKSWPDNVWKLSRTEDPKHRQMDRNIEEPQPEKIVEGWECWSKVTKKVYYYSPEYNYGFLYEMEDPYHLRGFFPVPKFAISAKPSKSLYPTPIFVRLWPTLQMLHLMYGRVFDLIDAVRRRAIVDSENDGLIDALNNLGNLEFNAIQNFKGFVEKAGSLENLIWYIPVQELVNAIGELNQQDDKFKDNIYEWFGLPDIMRGLSDPIETATAQEVKMSAATNRSKDPRRMIDELCRDTLEMMIDMALYLYDDAKIAVMVGLEFWDEQDQAIFPQALAALRNDGERAVRIEIETDSTSYMGEQIRMAQRNSVTTTLLEGLQKVQPLMEMSPQAAAAAVKIMAFSLETMPGGRRFIGDATQVLTSLAEKMEQPQDQGPDYQGMQMQLEQTKADSQLMRAQIEAQKIQIDNQVKLADSQRKDFELALKQQAQEFEQYLKNQQEQFKQMIQTEYFGLDTAKAEGENNERMAEEERLAFEAKVNAVKVNTEEKQEAAGNTTVIINSPGQVPSLPDGLL